MTTAPKSPAKRPKAVVEASIATKPSKPLKEAPEPQYSMPREVSSWIEQANATIQYLRGEIDRLNVELNELKAYKRWAEQRILRSDHE
jgi:hypothetical protein